MISSFDYVLREKPGSSAVIFRPDTIGDGLGRTSFRIMFATLLPVLSALSTSVDSVAPSSNTGCVVGAVVVVFASVGAVMLLCTRCSGDGDGRGSLLLSVRSTSEDECER